MCNRLSFVMQPVILKALNPITLEWGNTTYVVNASLRLAMTASSMADEISWLGAADQACYIAKHQGRGRLQIATASPTAPARQSV